MIELHQFPRLWNIANASPFCMKVETYLRMATIPYKPIFSFHLKKAPKRKFPYIVDGDIKLGDSYFILNYLEKKYQAKLNEHLDKQQLALSFIIEKMLDEFLYWILLYSRWCDENYWPQTKKAFFGNLKGIGKYTIPFVVRRKMIKNVYSQGIGKHSSEEVYQFGSDVIQNIANLMGSNLFFFGNEPSRIDACLYGFLGNFLFCPIEIPVKKEIQKHENLVRFCEIIRQKYYADLGS